MSSSLFTKLDRFLLKLENNNFLSLSNKTFLDDFVKTGESNKGIINMNTISLVLGKTMETVTGKLKKVTKLLGFDFKSGKSNFSVLFYFFLLIIMFTNVITFLFHNWNNMNLRIHCLKALTFFCIVGLYSMNYIFSWKNFKLTVDIIEEGYHEYPINISRNRKELLKLLNKELIEQNEITYYAVKMYIMVANVVPLFSTIFRLLTENINDINVEQLLLPYPFHYPTQFRSLKYYFIIYLSQALYNIYALGYAYISYASSFNSMQVAVNEIKLLCISINEIEDRFSSKNINKEEIKELKHSFGDITEHNHVYGINDLSSIKEYLKYIIKHHQNICRKVKSVNKGIEAIAVVYNYGISIFLCMSIYFIAQKEKIVFKFTEGLLCIPAAYIIYLYDLIGESIMNEDESLRRSLYECSWIDKPEWFKKSLQIIMTRNNSPIQIKPFGLHVLNLNNFCKAMNAAYSYYSVINGIKKN